MENIKIKLLQQIESYVKSSSEDISQKMNKIGSHRKGTHMNQYALCGNITFEEVFYIKPSKPKFLQGTLLASPSGLDDDNEDLLTGLSIKRLRKNDLEANIEFGVVKNIHELGKVRRYIKAENVMVIDESIQVQKFVNIEVAEDIKKSINQFSVKYTIKHVLHVLDSKKKITVPTTMFKTNPKSKYSSDLTMNDEFDYEAIMAIYNTSKAEEVIAPLVILNKNK